ncbi:MAG TPA: nuclease-related domain-containing protein [Galbitalea sp.]|nr:nuclease-related domain-containing protein [Galbitalea sp.]
MTITDPRGGVELTLTARGAGYAAIQQCLELQSEVAPVGPVAHFFGASPLAQNARSWYLGALGEIVVAEKLERLGEGWHVIDAVPVGAAGSDIDHVVIGPTGVFTINTKAHANKKVWAAGHALRINGFKQHYIRNSQHEAARASKLLTSAVGRPIDVTPLIVMVGISELNYGVRRPEVDVVTSRGIVRNLRRRRRTLTPDAVAEIADVAGRRGTWHRDAIVLDDTQRHVQRFERLRSEVDAASRRRKAWVLLMELAVIVGVVWLCIDMLDVIVRALAVGVLH